MLYQQILNTVQKLETLENGFENLLDKISAVSAGLGACAALLYIGSKIWQNIANAEPVNFYPLLKPFVVLILCINFNLFIKTFVTITQSNNNGYKIPDKRCELVTCNH